MAMTVQPKQNRSKVRLIHASFCFWRKENLNMDYPHEVNKNLLLSANGCYRLLSLWQKNLLCFFFFLLGCLGKFF